MKNLLKIELICFLVLIVFLSCKKSLLDPGYVPPPAVFPVKNQTNIVITPPDVEAKVEVKPVVSPDGTVFGKFVNRFKFKGDWYVMAEEMYQYNNNGTLSITAYNILLKIEDSKITIIAKDLYSYSDAWYYLNRVGRGYGAENSMPSSTIEPNRLIFENHYNSVQITRATTPKFPANGSTRDYIDKVKRIKYVYTTTDLINWTTTPLEQYILDFIKPVYFRQPWDEIDEDGNRDPQAYFKFRNTNWQGRIGRGLNDSELKVIYFKDFIYVLGGCLGFQYVEQDGYREHNLGTFSTTAGIVRIQLNIDNSLDKNITYIGEWEICKIPSSLVREGLSAVVSSDGNKMYIKGGYKDIWKHYDGPDGKWYHDIDYRYNDIWVTEDGINWWQTSEYPSTGSSGLEKFQTRTKLIPTPKEADEQTVAGKTFYPSWNAWKGVESLTNKIKEHAYKENINFPIEDYRDIIFNTHAKDILIQSNDINGLPIYHEITAKNQISTNFMWTGNNNYNYEANTLFNINGKLVRLIDYYYPSINSKSGISQSTVNSYSNNAYIWRERMYITSTNAPGTYEKMTFWGTNIVYTQTDCAYWAMLYDSYKYVAEYYVTNSNPTLPSKPVTHYSIEFEF